MMGDLLYEKMTALLSKNTLCITLMSCGEHDYYSKQSQRKINHDRFTGEKKTSNPEEMPKIVIQEDWLSIKKVYHVGGLDFSESNLYLKFSSLPSLNILRRGSMFTGKIPMEFEDINTIFFSLNFAGKLNILFNWLDLH